MLIQIYIVISQTIKKRAKDLSTSFPEEDRGMANKYMKKGPTALALREMQTKSTMRY